jgi:hypothetical protein
MGGGGWFVGLYVMPSRKIQSQVQVETGNIATMYPISLSATTHRSLAVTYEFCYKCVHIKKMQFVVASWIDR